MIEKDFRDSLTFKFFNEAINCELLRNRFEYLINSVNESFEHRYFLKYNRIFYNIRGNVNYAEITVEAIPMTESILVVHASVTNRTQKLRTKVKCSFDEHEKTEALAKFKSEFIDKLISVCTIGLNELPDELKIEICKYLSLFSLVNLANANRYWQDFIFNDDVLWKYLYIRDFGGLCVSFRLQGNRARSNHTNEVNAISCSRTVVALIAGQTQPKLDSISWKEMYKNEFEKRRLKKSRENRWIYR